LLDTLIEVPLHKLSTPQVELLRILHAEGALAPVRKRVSGHYRSHLTIKGAMYKRRERPMFGSQEDECSVYCMFTYY
jgi:hypothetical protein